MGGGGGGDEWGLNLLDLVAKGFDKGYLFRSKWRTSLTAFAVTNGLMNGDL